MLDYGVPGIVAVGSGLLAFMLTGGPEEFPEPDPEELQVDNTGVSAAPEQVMNLIVVPRSNMLVLLIFLSVCTTGKSN